MQTTRRGLLNVGVAAATAAALKPARLFAAEAAGSLQPMTGGIVPIAREE